MSSYDISKNDIYFYNIWPISKLCTPPSHHLKKATPPAIRLFPANAKQQSWQFAEGAKRFLSSSTFQTSVFSKGRFFCPNTLPPWFHLSPLLRNKPWRMLTRFIDIHIYIYHPHICILSIYKYTIHYNTTRATFRNQVIDWNSLRAPELIYACGHVDNLGETLETWVLMTKMQKVKQVFSKEAPCNVLCTCLGILLLHYKSFWMGFISSPASCKGYPEIHRPLYSRDLHRLLQQWVSSKVHILIQQGVTLIIW